nr:reverse transcriptase domain-containing protein [Tanacetum cinerariifolium]
QDADQRTLAQLLQAPTEGYEDAIVVPVITADNFELKHGLLTLVQNKQCFGHDKEDPHAHVRYFNKITSTLKLPNIPNTSIKLMLFPFSLEGAARIWLKKEPPRSIFTWDDLVLKFINQFFVPSKTTNLRNEITNFQQRFDESFNQDSLNSATGGNFLDKMPRESLAIIESKSKVRYSRNKPVVAKVSANTSTSGISPDVTELKDMVKALLLNKKSQSLALVKAVEESCVTCGDALILMPKFSSTLKALIGNKEKLSKMARTPLNEHCSTVILKKLPEKLGNPGKFLIQCDLPGMAECLALAYLGASFNLMPFSVWKGLSLPDLTRTCMTLELANRSISRPVGVAEDVYVKLGSFHFSTDFIVIDFDVDPRVPLILGRSFIKTGRALIDVFEAELTLRDGKEAITFNLDQTSRYSSNYSDMMTKRIDVIGMACEEYSQEVLEAFLNDDPSPPPNQGNYLPEVRKELKIFEAKFGKSLVDERLAVKLKDLPPHLEYAFLEGDDKLPVIIVKDLSVEEKTALITDFKPAVQHQRRVNPKIHDVIKQEVIKILEARLIYPIFDSPWVRPVHSVPKKGWFIVVENVDNELIPTLLVTRCPWVRPVHSVPKKGWFIVVENVDNELIPTLLVTR